MVQDLHVSFFVMMTGFLPFKIWYCSFDPYKGIPPDHHHQVLGGESALWTETTDDTNIDSKVWPRCAALAEVLWTGGGQAGFPRGTETA
jgi:hexosaminidase